MEEGVLIGYHATARENILPIISNKFKISEPGRRHWLGKGVYFFEDIYYAVEWQLLGVLKKDKKIIVDYDDLIKKSGIIISKMDINKYSVLDLSTPYGYSIFETLLDTIKTCCTEQKYEEHKKKGDKFLIDLVEEIEMKNGIKILSKFDIISAEYPKNITENKGIHGNFIKCTQKQICVKNIDAIIDNQEYNDSNIIRNNYALISKNRRRMSHD